MKKFSSRNALKLVAATSMTIFSLLSVFSATAAWFDSQRNLNEGATSFGVASGSKINILSCYAYRYGGQSGATEQSVAPSGFQISMPEYDYVLPDRNTHTAVFFRLEIGGFTNAKKLVVTVPSTQAYTDNDTDNMSYAEGDEIQNYVSNVVGVRFFTGLVSDQGGLVQDTFVPESSDPSEVYDAIAERAAQCAAHPFVSGGSKSSSFNLEIAASLVSSQTQTYDNGQKQKIVVYVAFDYYIYGSSVNLVEDFVDSRGDLIDYVFISDIDTLTLNEVNP